MTRFTEGSLKIIKGVALELWYIGKLEFMKVNGRMTLGMVKAWNATQMETDMKVNSKMVNRMARVYTLGQTEKYMRESGLVV
jgi:hypothetical protein